MASPRWSFSFTKEVLLTGILYVAVFELVFVGGYCGIVVLARHLESRKASAERKISDEDK